MSPFHEIRFYEQGRQRTVSAVASRTLAVFKDGLERQPLPADAGKKQ